MPAIIHGLIRGLSADIHATAIGIATRRNGFCVSLLLAAPDAPSIVADSDMRGCTSAHTSNDSQSAFAAVASFLAASGLAHTEAQADAIALYVHSIVYALHDAECPYTRELHLA